jgi:adenylate cyclase
MRHLFRLIPHEPRCKLCAAPFHGVGAPVMRIIGKAPAVQNPGICGQCFTFMSQHHGGAEIEGTHLFADIRGSTTLAEQMSGAEFRALIDRYFAVGTKAIFEHDGAVDKLLGDGIVAYFVPLFSGQQHAALAIEAGRALLHATGHGEAGGPWVPVGVGIATGVAWVGAVGDETRTDLTTLGDVVNTAARLGGVAEAGEMLVTVETATAADLEPTLERRSLELKGKGNPTEVVSLRVGPAAAV